MMAKNSLRTSPPLSDRVPVERRTARATAMPAALAAAAMLAVERVGGGRVRSEVAGELVADAAVISA